MPLKHFFGNLAVGKKLAASFVILLILLIIVSAVGYFSLNDYNRSTSIVKYANAAEIGLLKAERGEKSFAITQDSKYIKRAIEFVVHTESALTPLIEMNEAGSEDRQLAERIRDGKGSYEALLKRYETAISGPPDIVRTLEEEMYAVATSTIDMMEELKYGEQAQLQEIYDLAVAEIIIVTVIALLVAIVLAWILTRSITRPINEAVEIANKVASGDLTVNVQSQRGDEFGQLLAAFATMITNLRELIREIDTGASSIASSSEELSTVTNQTSQGVAEQQSQTDQVATAMNEMVATVNEVAKSAEAAFEAANQASEKSSNGEKAVRETLDLVADLNKQSANVMEQLNGLQAETNNIATVLDVIKAVADQTNLLALNAAIEAARAGEHGRGFSVVADEVRQLAQRTSQSTTQIHGLITQLQASSNNAVQSMEHGQRQAQEGVAWVLEADQALVGISEAVSHITDMTTQIAAATEEQSAVAEEISRNITTIAELADQTSIQAHQSTDLSKELTNTASTQYALVERFNR